MLQAVAHVYVVFWFLTIKTIKIHRNTLQILERIAYCLFQRHV